MSTEKPETVYLVTQNDSVAFYATFSLSLAEAIAKERLKNLMDGEYTCVVKMPIEKEAYSPVEEEFRHPRY